MDISSSKVCYRFYFVNFRHGLIIFAHADTVVLSHCAPDIKSPAEEPVYTEVYDSNKQHPYLIGAAKPEELLGKATK